MPDEEFEDRELWVGATPPTTPWLRPIRLAVIHENGKPAEMFISPTEARSIIRMLHNELVARHPEALDGIRVSYDPPEASTEVHDNA